MSGEFKRDPSPREIGGPMDHNPDRISIWPGYFDVKSRRRAGRRVPKDSAVRKPDLEGLFMAARSVGLRKIKREERTSHPKRPHGKEGRLWVSRNGASDSIGSSSKEEIMQMIGCNWREMQSAVEKAEKASTQRGPAKGDRSARAQRKSRISQRTQRRGKR